MPALYATLEDLVRPALTESGDTTDSVSIYRLNFGQAAPIFETDDPIQRINAFCAASCFAGGSGGKDRIKAESLDAADAAELVSALVDMATPDKNITFDGDGVSHPIVYTLIYPIKLTATQDLTQFGFCARTLGQIVGFLNAEGEVASFREFMRGFSDIVGVPMPVTDTIVDALDIKDYANVKEHIMGKLTKSRGRLKKPS